MKKYFIFIPQIEVLTAVLENSQQISSIPSQGIH